MKFSVPYITIADLGTVLDQCCNEIGFIDDTTRQRILNLVSDYTAERIRIGEAGHKENMLRDRCIKECNRKYRETRSEINRQRASNHFEYNVKTREARDAYEVCRTDIRAKFRVNLEDIFDDITDINERLVGVPMVSPERDELCSQRRELEKRIHGEKSRRAACFHDAQRTLASTLNGLTTLLSKQELELRERTTNALNERNMKLRVIAEAKTDELQVILDELVRGKEELS